MKNRKIWLGILVAVFALAVAGCDNGSTTTNNNDAGELAGTWNGTVMGYTATVVVSNSGWTISIPGLFYADTGSFDRNGNSAILYSNTNGKNVGTANIIDANNVQLVLNGNSDAPGTYSLTKQ